MRLAAFHTCAKHILYNRDIYYNFMYKSSKIYEIIYLPSYRYLLYLILLLYLCIFNKLTCFIRLNLLDTVPCGT